MDRFVILYFMVLVPLAGTEMLGPINGIKVKTGLIPRIGFMVLLDGFFTWYSMVLAPLTGTEKFGPITINGIKAKKGIPACAIIVNMFRPISSVSPVFEKPAGTSKSPAGTKTGDKYASGGPGRPGPP